MAKFLFMYFHNIEAMVKEGMPKGGSVVQTINWMRALHELGHEVLQVREEGDTRELLKEFQWVKTVPFYHTKKFKKRLVWFTYRFPKYYSLLKKTKCDYTYVSMPHWTIYFTGVISKSLGIKQIVRLANDKNVDRSLAKDQSFLFYFFMDIGLKNNFLTLAQNKFQLETLKNKYHINAAHRISNPIVIDQSLLTAKSDIKGYIAWLANFRHQKNLRLLYEIASTLSFEKFRVAGKPLEPMDDESSIYYQKLQKLSNVDFVGGLPRSSVFSFLKEAKFLLSTSRYEGFSNTFLESMVVGTPILTTPAVNPDSIISDFELGYIYQDAEDLKNKLKNMDLSDYLEKSKNCIAYVKENHDHIHLGKKLLGFLNEPILNNENSEG